MKFLPVCIVLTLLTCLSVSVTFGNPRNLQAYNCLQFDANNRCIKCIPRTVNIDGQCRAVSDLCKAWDQNNGDCTQCYKGYLLSGDKCVADQDPYPRAPSSQNIPVKPQSVHIQNNTLINENVIKNQTNATQQTNQTESAKSSQFNPQAASIPLAYNCLLFDANNRCLKCIPRTVNIEGICKAVSDLCKAWDQRYGDCTQCYQGYILSEGKCIVGQIPLPTTPQPVRPSVSLHQNNTVINTENIVNNTNATTQQSAKKKAQFIPQASNCLQFDANNRCTKCILRTVNIDGQCHAVSDLCKSWYERNGDCAQCYKGYVLSEGKCVIGQLPQPTTPQPVKPSVSIHQNNTANATKQTATKKRAQFIPFAYNCLQFEVNNKCTKCIPRTVNIDGVCRAVSDFCKAWDQRYGDCTQCYKGFVLIQGKCIMQILPIPQQAPPPRPSATGPQFVPSQNITEIIPPAQQNITNATIPIITPAQQNITNATIPTIVPPTQQNITNATIPIIVPPTQQNITNATIPIIVPPTQQNITIPTIIPLINQTQTINITQLGNITIELNITIEANISAETNMTIRPRLPGSVSPTEGQYNLCVQEDDNGSCIECAYRSILVDGTCQPVNDQCRQWDEVTGECTACYGGYTLSKGECCYDQTQLCVQYDENNTCIACAPRSILIQGECRQVNGFCRQWNETNAECTSCYDGFYLESGKCYVRIMVNDNLCAEANETGYCLRCLQRSVLVNGFCQPVSDFCRDYDVFSGNCTDCYEGYSLIEGACQYNNYNQTIIQTDPLCFLYDLDGNCIKCATRSILKNGICQKVAEQCYNWDQNTGECKECCKGFTLQNGICIP